MSISNKHARMGCSELMTYSQERCLALPGELGSQHHALGSTQTKASRNDDARGTANFLPRLVVLVLLCGLGLGFQVFGIDPD